MKRGEGVALWKNLFKKLLYNSENSMREEEAREGSSGEEMGDNGLTVEMVNRKSLVEVWYKLLYLCWRSGRIPSMWRRSMVIPIPEKRKLGPLCNTEDFRGISVNQ